MSSSKTAKPAAAARKQKTARPSSASAHDQNPPSHQRSKSPSLRNAGRIAASTLPLVDDLDEFSAPPIAGKAHPRDAMDEMVPTLDDSDRMFRHHPNDSVGESFSFDPDSADAAADLAGDLGSEFLEGATRGQDMSDIIAAESDRDEETAYLLEDLGVEEGEEEQESEEDAYMSDEDIEDADDILQADDRTEESARKSPSRVRPRPT